MFKIRNKLQDKISTMITKGKIYSYTDEILHSYCGCQGQGGSGCSGRYCAQGCNGDCSSTSFRNDKVKYGGFIGGSKEDCIILYHPKHQDDYFNFVFQVAYQGNYAFISANSFGVSKLIGTEEADKFFSDTMQQGSVEQKVGAILGAGFRKLFSGKNVKKRLEEEKNWYAMVGDIFDELFTNK